MNEIEKYILLNEELMKKYNVFDNIPRKEQKELQKTIKDVCEVTGLTNNELHMIEDIRKYNISSFVNCYIIRCKEEILDWRRVSALLRNRELENEEE